MYGDIRFQSEKIVYEKVINRMASKNKPIVLHNQEQNGILDRFPAIHLEAVAKKALISLLNNDGEWETRIEELRQKIINPDNFTESLANRLPVLLEINFKEPSGADGIDPYDLKQPLPELPDEDWEVVIEMLGSGEISPSDAFHLGLSKREIESVIQRPITDEELRD